MRHRCIRNQNDKGENKSMFPVAKYFRILALASVFIERET